MYGQSFDGNKAIGFMRQRQVWLKGLVEGTPHAQELERCAESLAFVCHVLMSTKLTDEQRDRYQDEATQYGQILLGALQMERGVEWVLHRSRSIVAHQVSCKSLPRGARTHSSSEGSGSTCTSTG